MSIETWRSRPGRLSVRTGASPFTALVLIVPLACSGPESVDVRPSQLPVDTGGQQFPDLAPAVVDTQESGSGVATVSLTIYFSRGEEVVPVVRRVPADSVSLATALRHLLRGPTQRERSAGLHSWFSDTTAGALRSVTLSPEGRAVVDFHDLRTMIPNASSSAGSGMLLRELNATVFSHATVQSVQYRIDGSCDAFGEWLQYGCQTVSRP